MTWLLHDEEFWENGIPLRHADWHFASVGLRAIYRMTRSLCLAIEPREEPHDTTPSGHPLSFHWPAADRIGSILHRTEELLLLFVFEIRAEMRSRLLRALAAGELLGYGFEIPRKQNDFPIELPLDAFQAGDVDWADSAVERAGRAFTLVRIVRPRYVKHKGR